MESKRIKLYALAAMISFTLLLGQVNASEYINYYNISMTSQQYNNLLNLGFSEDEIYYMDQNTFESNKDLSGELVSKNNKYYKTIYTGLDGNSYSTEISEDEYENQSSMNTRGTVSTEYKNMVTTITRLTNTFRYKVTLAWKQMPSFRGYDIIGIGFNDDVYISSSLYFSYYYCLASGDCTTSTLYNYRQTTTTGGSVVYKLPGSEAKSLTAVLYYDVSKDTSSTITRLDMYGDYAHATNNVSYSQYSNHGINVNGIILGTNIGYYDAIPCAQSTWGGSW